MHVGSVKVLERRQKLGDGPVFAISDATLRKGKLESRGWRLRGGGRGGCRCSDKHHEANAEHDVRVFCALAVENRVKRGAQRT